MGKCITIFNEHKSILNHRVSLSGEKSVIFWCCIKCLWKVSIVRRKQKQVKCLHELMILNVPLVAFASLLLNLLVLSMFFIFIFYNNEHPN